MLAMQMNFARSSISPIFCSFKIKYPHCFSVYVYKTGKDQGRLALVSSHDWAINIWNILQR